MASTVLRRLPWSPHLTPALSTLSSYFLLKLLQSAMKLDLSRVTTDLHVAKSRRQVLILLYFTTDIERSWTFLPITKHFLLDARTPCSLDFPPPSWLSLIGVLFWAFPELLFLISLPLRAGVAGGSVLLPELQTQGTSNSLLDIFVWINNKQYNHIGSKQIT